MPFLFCFLQENTKVFCSLRLDKCRCWKKYQSHDAKSCVAKPWNWERNSCFRCSLTLLCLRVKLLWFLEKSKHRPKRKPKLCCQRLTPPHLEASAMDFFLLDEQWTKLKLDEIVHEQEHCSVFHIWFKSIHVDLRFHAKPFGSCVYLSSGESHKNDSQRTSMAKTPKKKHTFDHKTSHKTEFPHGISSPGLCLGRHCFADVHKVCGTMSTPQRSVKSESNSRQKIANHSQKCRKNSDFKMLHEFTWCNSLQKKKVRTMWILLSVLDSLLFQPRCG